MKSPALTIDPSQSTTRGETRRGAVPSRSTSAPRLIASQGRFDNYRQTQRRGTAAVEFAVILPILVTVLLGATDFGRFSYSAIAVANAARSGAAYGIMTPFDATSQGAWQAAVTRAAIDELSQSPAFDTSKLAVTSATVTEASGLRRVSVQATYPFKTIVNWTIIPNTFNLTHTVVMRGIR